MLKLHPEAQQRLERIIASGERPMEEMSAQEARVIADARVLSGSFALRQGITSVDRTIPGPGGAIPLRIYRPRNPGGAMRLSSLAVSAFFSALGIVDVKPTWCSRPSSP